MLKIINVAGARPNFMKIAPLVAAMNRRRADFNSILVHTGQHYDASMSQAFFRDLEMPEPDIDLGVGSASHAVQTAGIIQAFEPVVISEKPDWVVVVGDVNSTMACALVCAKLDVKSRTSKPACAAAIEPCPKRSIACSLIKSRISCSRRRVTPIKTCWPKVFRRSAFAWSATS